LRHVIRGFDGTVWSASFAPDGKTLVTGSSGLHSSRIQERPRSQEGRIFTELKWWDLQTGELKQRIELPGEDRISVMAFHSPDGRVLATIEYHSAIMFSPFGSFGSFDDLSRPRMAMPMSYLVSYDTDLRLLDARTGEVRLKLKEGLNINGGPLFMGSYSSPDLFSMFVMNQRRQPLAFSPDGQLVASWNSSEIKLWSTVTGEEVRKLKKFNGRLSAVAFAPDSRTLVAGATKFSFKNDLPTFKSEVQIRDVATGTVTHTIAVNTQSITSVTFALNGKQLIIGGLQNDGQRSFASLELADIQTGSLGSLLSNDEGTASSLVLSPNGAMLAFQTDASTVKLLDTQNWRIKYAFDETSDGSSSGNTAMRRFLLSVKSVLGLAFSADGKTIAGSIEQGGIKLWDPRTGEVKKHLGEHEEQPSLVEISDNAATVVEADDKATLRWFDLASGYDTVFTETDPQMSAIGVSTNGRVLAIAHHDRIALLNLATRKSMGALTAQGRDISCLVFSLDGEMLAASGESGAIDVWNLPSGQRNLTINSAGKVTALRFAPGGRILASASEDGSVRLWDLQTGALVVQLKKHNATVNAVAFSPDGNLVATGSDDRTAIIWETATGKARRTLKGHDLAVTSLAFSPDGTLLACGSGNASVVLWDVQTGKLNRVLK
jgi:WD40 repeat protein